MRSSLGSNWFRPPIKYLLAVDNLWIIPVWLFPYPVVTYAG